MSKPTSSDVAAASADLLYAHIRNAKEQLRNDKNVLIYSDAVSVDEEDSIESALISERTLKEHLRNRIDFYETEIPVLEAAYARVIKFIRD